MESIPALEITGPLSAVLKRRSYVAYHTHPSSDEVKMRGNMSPLPHIFHVVGFTYLQK
jgi:hypothetical protein